MSETPVEKEPSGQETSAKPAAKAKPPKPEDKPFPEFIDSLFVPAVAKQLADHNITESELIHRVKQKANRRVSLFFLRITNLAAQD